jgi:hypothetical protein
LITVGADVTINHCLPSATSRVDWLGVWHEDIDLAGGADHDSSRRTARGENLAPGPNITTITSDHTEHVTSYLLVGRALLASGPEQTPLADGQRVSSL